MAPTSGNNYIITHFNLNPPPHHAPSMAQAHSLSISLGGNRVPSAGSWSTNGTETLLAFGAGRCVALWDPKDEDYRGVTATLKGHGAKVNVVRILEGTESPVIVSGDAKGELVVWEKQVDGSFGIAARPEREGREAINTISTIRTEDQKRWLVAVGTADGFVEVWEVGLEETGVAVKHVQDIQTRPKYLPLATSIGILKAEGAEKGAYILAIGGSTNVIHIWGASTTDPRCEFTLKASLAGHENWVRSLAFTQDAKVAGDLILASASQDKYIRLWRFHPGGVMSSKENSETSSLSRNLSNKAHVFSVESTTYSALFEALLIGHEDWVYTIEWDRSGKMRLLSSSADNSVAIWEEDEDSEIWLCTARVGEMSDTKGASTATGSAGGLWNALWSPDGESIAALGKTGSWRVWKHNSGDLWDPAVGITGHNKDVVGLSWSPSGQHLLTTSLDQTTRLFARWIRKDGRVSWHEFARPQIHGYDLSCISALGETNFVSGAEEKLLRVFKEPKPVASYLQRLCNISSNEQSDLAEFASQPVLGLSNKAVADDTSEGGQQISSWTETLSHPPFEDALSRNTLFPETEKLYGHGHEISALAISKSRKFTATACKASSIDHAVIRLYETTLWRELKPPLKAHELTVTKLDFSTDDRYLLSVGRDRRWAVFKQDEGTETPGYKLLTQDPKGHTRMILDGKWLPDSKTGRAFATAGRDKSVKIWDTELEGEGTEKWTSVATIKFTEPVTAIAFAPESSNGVVHLCVGTESGALFIYSSSAIGLSTWVPAYSFPAPLNPDLTVNEIEWNPSKTGPYEVAVASADGSCRVFEVSF